MPCPIMQKSQAWAACAAVRIKRKRRMWRQDFIMSGGADAKQGVNAIQVILPERLEVCLVRHPDPGPLRHDQPGLLEPSALGVEREDLVVLHPELEHLSRSLCLLLGGKRQSQRLGLLKAGQRIQGVDQV